MSDVELSIVGNVAVITLNAPARRNALNPDMTRRLASLCDEIDRNLDVGAAMIQGAGGSFCAGADRGHLVQRGQSSEVLAPSDPGDVYRAFTRVGELLVPTVAAVRGYAVGAGLNLAFATDLRIVAEDAILRSGFNRIGIHPGGGHYVLVSRTAGREAVAAMALFGQDLTGLQAAAIGAAWEAVPDGRVESRALELAEIAGKDPELARASVRSMRLELGPPTVSWPAAVEMERSVQMWSLQRREALKDAQEHAS
jgi:enoyl-CoA hydratase